MLARGMHMKRVMLLNPKGGSGKTTLATTLASHFAGKGHATVLFDHDAQGSSTRWLNVRPPNFPAIHGVAAFENNSGVTKAWQMRVPTGTTRVVVDTPAGVKAHALISMIRTANRIVIPVLPSHIDIDAVASFIQDLAGIDSVRDGDTKVAVVANRVRTRTVIFHELEEFLRRVSFPFITRLRDSQNYARAGGRGLGVHDLSANQTQVDRQQWKPLLAWLDGDTVPELAPLNSPGRSAARDTYCLPL